MPSEQTRPVIRREFIIKHMQIPGRKIKRQTRSTASRFPKVALAWFIVISLASVLSIGCPHQQHRLKPDQSRLVYRINQYYKALQAREYTKTQLFYANRRPQTPAERSSLASKLSFQLAAYEIQSMHIDDMEAQVVMHVTVTGLDNHYDIVMTDRWQYIGNNWYVLDSAQSAPDESIQSLDRKMLRNHIKW